MSQAERERLRLEYEERRASIQVSVAKAQETAEKATAAAAKQSWAETKKAIEDEIIALTNEERVKAGLPALVHDEAISDIARAHSANMWFQRRLDHNMDGLSSTDRALNAGYDCKRLFSPTTYTYGLSENIWRIEVWGGMYAEARVAQAAVDGWMNSPGHRKNILDPQAVRIGVGVAGGGESWYATQNFSSCLTTEPAPSKDQQSNPFQPQPTPTTPIIYGSP